MMPKFEVFQFKNIELVGKIGNEPVKETRFNRSAQSEKKSEFEVGGFARDFKKDKDASAKKEAEGILEEAKVKAEEIEKAAYKKGFEEGKRNGLEEGKRAVEPLIETFKKEILEIGKIKEEIYSSIETEMLELILSISRKVIHKEVATDKDAVLNTIKTAVGSVVSKEEIKIKVNPEDLELAKEIKMDITNLVEGVKNITFEGDISVGRGGCIIETNYGSVDARIEEQMEAVEHALKSMVSGQ
jgi:flagellar assembly protein FliH